MGLPRVSGDMARRVRGKERRQRVRRSLATGMAIVVLGMVAILIPRKRPEPVVRMERASVLDTDGKVAELVADILKKDASDKRTISASEADDYLWQVSQERNRAALILVRGGDRIYAESHDRPTAETDYRLAIQLFPNSPAAGVAQQRLRALDPRGDES